MIEIKFRGRRADNGEWVYGDLIENQGRFFIYHASSETTLIDNNNRDITVIATAVDNGTLGQFTGLHDKHGKEIYEGDIVNIPYSVLGNCEVIHDGYGWAFYTKADNIDGSRQYQTIRSFSFSFRQGTIIGNIHENPELLKGGEE